MSGAGIDIDGARNLSEVSSKEAGASVEVKLIGEEITAGDREVVIGRERRVAEIDVAIKSGDRAVSIIERYIVREGAGREIDVAGGGGEGAGVGEGAGGRGEVEVVGG
jgi:hypothetical protein